MRLKKEQKKIKISFPLGLYFRKLYHIEKFFGFNVRNQGQIKIE